jgi:ribosome-binding protein aMBF1 (putative translation factor)
MARRFSGRRLCEHRTARGLRHEHLALSLNRDTNTLRRYETGRVMPSADQVGALADALGIATDDLYDLEAATS